jgi:hypothetical protein
MTKLFQSLIGLYLLCFTLLSFASPVTMVTNPATITDYGNVIEDFESYATGNTFNSATQPYPMAGGWAQIWGGPSDHYYQYYLSSGIAFGSPVNNFGFEFSGTGTALAILDAAGDTYNFDISLFGWNSYGFNSDIGIVSVSFLTPDYSAYGYGSLDDIRVVSSSVPIPSAAWLFGGILIGFAGARKRKNM